LFQGKVEALVRDDKKIRIIPYCHAELVSASPSEKNPSSFLFPIPYLFDKLITERRISTLFLFI